MDIEKQIRNLHVKLFPTGRVWGWIHGPDQVDTEITEFVDGLNNPFVDGFGNRFIASYGSEASPGKRLENALLKSYVRLFEDIFSLTDSQIADNDNFDEIDASNWERIYFGKESTLSLEERKLNILRKQGYPNGVAERGNYLFIQDQLRAAGFDVYVHENRFSDGGSGWTTVDPNAQTNTFVANYINETIDSKYFDTLPFRPTELGVHELGNVELGNNSISVEVESRRSTFFICGETFPNTADVPLSRKDEFRELILKLKPCQVIGYLYINFV